MGSSNKLQLKDMSDDGSMLLATIRNIIKDDVNTMFLAKVKKVYDDKGTLKVDVDLVNKFNDDKGKPKQAREVLGLMVGYLSGGNAEVHFPIKVDDFGMCFVSKYDLTDYKMKGTQGLTKYNNQFQFHDSVFIPMHLQKQKKDSNDDFLFKTEKVEVRLSLEGDLLYKNEKFTLDLKNSGDFVYNNEKYTHDVKNSGDYNIKNDNNIIDVKNDGDIKITAKDGNIDMKNNGDITITAKQAIADMKNGGDIEVKNNSGGVKIDSGGNVTVKGTTIKVGEGASEPLVLGNQIVTLLTALINGLLTHTHPTAKPGDPTLKSGDFATVGAKALTDLANILSKTNTVK